MANLDFLDHEKISWLCLEFWESLRFSEGGDAGCGDIVTV